MSNKISDGTSTSKENKIKSFGKLESREISRERLIEFSNSETAKTLGQEMWPKDSKYRFLPHPVALELSGWYREFELSIKRMPEISDALNRVLPKPEAWLNQIAKDIYDFLNINETKNLLLAVGLPGTYYLQALTWYLYHHQFKALKGALIETTDSLNRMLSCSDIAEDLPIKLFTAPFQSTYVHFGNGISAYEDENETIKIVGAYVLYQEGVAHLGAPANPLNGELLNYEGAKNFGIKEGDYYKKVDVIFSRINTISLASKSVDL